jgi:hypothetical protein
MKRKKVFPELNYTGLLSLVRRHEKNLKPEQKIKIEGYLSLNPVSKGIYDFKQKLCALLGVKSKNKTVLRPIIHDLI